MIGVFDSGFGGLSIFRELIKTLPSYDFIYFGDNARYPYGDRSQDTVLRFTKEATAWLFSQGCELVILACNTASAQALRRLQQEWLSTQPPHKRILGVLVPLAEAVAQHAIPQDRIGIIATRGTVRSGSYPRELAKYLPEGAMVIQQACPLFVPLVEEGWAAHPIAEAIAYHYLTPLCKDNITKLILGCTHYPFLAPLISRVMGEQCQLFEPGSIVANSLSSYLSRHKDLDARLAKQGARRYMTTDDPERFREFAHALADLTIQPEHLPLGELEHI